MKSTRTQSPDRSQKILDAALALFTEAGFHNTRIEDIARRAGVAKGTVYLYFPGKKELFGALIERITATHLATVGRILEGRGGLEQKLVLTARAHLALGPPKQDMTTLNLHEIIASDDALRTKMCLFHARYTELIASLLRGSAGGVQTNSDVFRDGAVAFIGVLQAFKMEMIHGRQVPDADALSEQIVALFLRGFDPREPNAAGARLNSLKP